MEGSGSKAKSPVGRQERSGGKKRELDQELPEAGRASDAKKARLSQKSDVSQFFPDHGTILGDDVGTRAVGDRGVGVVRLRDQVSQSSQAQRNEPPAQLNELQAQRNELLAQRDELRAALFQARRDELPPAPEPSGVPAGTEDKAAEKSAGAAQDTAVGKEALEGLLEDVKCPICLATLRRPVALIPCMHHICAGCYAGCKERGRRLCCPTCRAPVKGSGRNHTLASLIDRLVTAHPEHQRQAEDPEELDETHHSWDLALLRRQRIREEWVEWCLLRLSAFLFLTWIRFASAGAVLSLAAFALAPTDRVSWRLLCLVAFCLCDLPDKPWFVAASWLAATALDRVPVR